MFEKSLASIGIGSAQVEAKLERPRYRQGDLVRGKITVTAGEAEEKIDAIYLHIVTPNVKGKETGCLFTTYQIATSLEVGPNQPAKVIPFEFRLSNDMPVTLDDYSIYLKVGFESEQAGELEEEDQIEILPHPLAEHLFTAMDNVGCQLVGVEYVTGEYFPDLPFAQRFEFQTTGELKKILQGLSLFYRVDEEGVLEALMRMHFESGDKEERMIIKEEELDEDLGNLEQLIIELIIANE